MAHRYTTKHMPVDDYPYIQYVDEVDKEPEAENSETSDSNNSESESENVGGGE